MYHCTCLTGARSPNPFSNQLSYSDFAPWMGAQTRASNVLPKTKLLKGFSRKNSHDKPTTASATVNEDIILELLEKKKVNTMSFECKATD